MPKHYCDYCDVWLTHDSTAVRKAHNSGRNHLSNVRDYYASLGHDKAQTIIDQITQAFERGGGPPPGGFNFQFPAQPIPFGQSFNGPSPGFPAPPFPPAPGGPPFMPPGMMPPGMPPFPPNGGPGMPPNTFPPFPPSNAAENTNRPPSSGPPPTFVHATNSTPSSGPPATFVPATNSTPSSGPNIHPDRMRMLNGMQ